MRQALVELPEGVCVRFDPTDIDVAVVVGGHPRFLVWSAVSGNSGPKEDWAADGGVGFGLSCN